MEAYFFRYLVYSSIEDSQIVSCSSDLLYFLINLRNKDTVNVTRSGIFKRNYTCCLGVIAIYIWTSHFLKLG